jgi:hypothetical protein
LGSWLNLKQERVWQRHYANHAEAQRDITDYSVNIIGLTPASQLA